MTFAGRYYVSRQIAEGGMGAVFEVIHTETSRKRALKTLHPHIVRDPGVRARFQQEARVGALIESEFVVDVFDAGIDQQTGMPFLVMEMLRGQDLAEHMARGPLLPEQVLTYLKQAAGALDKAHRAGVIHRDLKPENLFLHQSDDAPPRVKILDFGIAKLVRDGTTAGNQTAKVGTPLYMAPEQYTGEAPASPATDTYALAQVAYALLVGEPYFNVEAERIDTIIGFGMAIVKGITEPPSARGSRRKGVRLPPGFDAWFAQAAAAQPAQRFQRASELVQALAAAYGLAAPASQVTGTHAPVQAPEQLARSHAPTAVAAATHQPLTTSTATSQVPKTNPLVFVAGGVGALCLVGALLVWAPWSEPPKSKKATSEAAATSEASAAPPSPASAAAVVVAPASAASSAASSAPPAESAPAPPPPASEAAKPAGPKAPPPPRVAGPKPGPKPSGNWSKYGRD